jgi:SsrA-binding protein
VTESARGKKAGRDVAINRRATHDYFVEERIEAGLLLTGTEVKALRAGHCNLRDGFVRVDRGDAWLENVHVSPYERGGYVNHDPLRPRKLLLHSAEISRLMGQVRQKGYTLIPLRVYFAGNWAKVEIGLCRGKRQYDKRQALAEADAKRQMERALG